MIISEDIMINMLGNAKNVFTQAELKRLLRYNPWNGKFYWRVNKGSALAGDISGCLDNGYVRLAQMYIRGYFPEYQMDHKKGIKNDNRWKEIRHVTPKCNQQSRKISKNNNSGFPGVYWDRKACKWRTSIVVNGKTIYLGQYKDKLEAALVRFAVEQQCAEWTCNYRSELVKAIRGVWPGFRF